MKINTQQPKTYGTQQRQSREGRSQPYRLTSEREKFLINNLSLYPQNLEEQQQRKPRASRKKEIIKIRAKLNNIEIKEQFKGSVHPGVGSSKR